MKRTGLLAALAIAIFGISTAALLQFMPQPLQQSDYLVIGSVSTLVTLLVVFLTLISTTLKTEDAFFKRRRKR